MQVAIRTETDTGHPALFFYESGELTCYTLAEGHCSASLEYYRTHTTPCRSFEGADLLNQWLAFPGGPDHVTVVQRLTRP